MIFSKVPRKFTSKAEGKMSYEDFVYFILSEEDKSSEPSIDYWYAFISLNCLFSFVFGNKLWNFMNYHYLKRSLSDYIYSYMKLTSIIVLSIMLFKEL